MSSNTRITKVSSVKLLSANEIARKVSLATSNMSSATDSDTSQEHKNKRKPEDVKSRGSPTAQIPTPESRQRVETDIPQSKLTPERRTTTSSKNGSAPNKDTVKNDLASKLASLIKKANKAGINDEVMLSAFMRQSSKCDDTNKNNTKQKLDKGKSHLSKQSRTFCSIRCLVKTAIWFVSLPVLLIAAGLATESGFTISGLMGTVRETRCVVENNQLMMEISRPRMNCSKCQYVTEAPVLWDVSRDHFVNEYAYTGLPTIIKGATKNWTALDTFGFKFFKKLYSNREAMKSVEEECQFFPWSSEFTTLAEVFNMSAERATLQPGQETWYIGWSNCDPKTADILRKHYTKPYFLPAESENSAIDWIFMGGGKGQGAEMHLDNVQRPSWQAQIHGEKMWLFDPPPECEDICHSFNVTLKTGDIITLDTNMWYHGTIVHPGAISICIGSEYD